MIIEANRHWQYTDTEIGLIMPWYVLPMLEWIKKQDVSTWNVFEYGAGYSSIWWSANAKDICSVEHDKTWARAMNAIHLSNEKDYIEFIDTYTDGGYADCIIVDGKWREKCVEFSKYFLKPAGFLIIDNWGQEDFPTDSCDRTLELLSGWSVQIFKQPNHSEWATALFQKPR